MANGFRRNLVVNFEMKMTICVFTGKTENLAEMPVLKGIFIFVANGHCFEKFQLLVEIISSLKKAASVLEKC